MTNRQAALKIVKHLANEGYEALFAGGCVRDMLLGRRAKDYDVVTNARPEDICRVFRRTIKVGAKFGVIVVMVDSQQVEVATFRTESGYADGRHPEKVDFACAKEDAVRRDFTINGMFYDPLKKEVIDYVGGQRDLQGKTIRTIGKAEDRFSEDYLRMLRALRFATRLDFEIEPRTFDAIKANSKKIVGISGERIAMEIEGLLACPNRQQGVTKMISAGLAENIFPVFKEASSAMFGASVCGHLPQKVSFPLALAALMSGCDPEQGLKDLKMLKMSRNQLKHLRFLLGNAGVLLDSDMSLAKLKTLLAEPYFDDLYGLENAIQKARGNSISALRAIRKRANALIGVELKPKPLLDGHELIRLGTPAGPQVGLVGRELYIEQLCERVTTAAEGRKWVKNWLKKHKDMD